MSLHSAAKKGDLESVHNHILNGCDVDLLDYDDITPLLYSVRMSRDNVAVAKMLIDAKADVNRKAYDGWTSLHSATLWESTKCMKLLIQSKANPSVQCNDGRTPLHVAIFECTECTQILIDAGCDYSICNQDKRTPLYYAINYCRIESATLLLDAGAKLDYDKPYPAWLSDLLAKRKSVKHALITFFALAKKTKAIHKDLVREIGRMIWEKREEWSIPPAFGGGNGPPHKKLKTE